ncbi:MAG: hypothetical protein ACFFDF_08070 [Candidatus Odinarchaeota archaeon]
MLSIEQDITEEDLLAFMKGVKEAVGTVVRLTKNKALQFYLASWVHKPLKELIEAYQDPEYLNISYLFEIKRPYRYLQEVKS